MWTQCVGVSSHNDWHWQCKDTCFNLLAYSMTIYFDNLGLIFCKSLLTKPAKLELVYTSPDWCLVNWGETGIKRKKKCASVIRHLSWQTEKQMAALAGTRRRSRSQQRELWELREFDRRWWFIRQPLFRHRHRHSPLEQTISVLRAVSHLTRSQGGTANQQNTSRRDRCSGIESGIKEGENAGSQKAIKTRALKQNVKKQTKWK